MKIAHRSSTFLRFARLGRGFTLTELLAVLATVVILAVVLVPALAGTKINNRAFQCMNNERQITLGWQMYAADNNDLLPPNDYPFNVPYRGKSPTVQYALRNWVVGTMASSLDANYRPELTSPNTLLSPYITNASVYHCPADMYVNPFTHAINVRSYSMSLAVGTLWASSFTYAGTAGTAAVGPLGAPVRGGWLPGNSYNANQTAWLTYGKMSSFTRPGPANTFVIMDENPVSINDDTFEASAFATPGNTYLIDFPSALHGASGVISFADGHIISHRWLDSRTYTPHVGIGGGGTGVSRELPDNADCFYLASITSAAR